MQKNKNDTIQNGKGDGPRNCFSQQYRDNYDSIKWDNNSKNTTKPLTDDECLILNQLYSNLNDG